VKTLSGHSKNVESVSFSPDGSLLASGSRDEAVKLWQVSTGTETSAQQLCDAIGKKDGLIEGQKTFQREKETLIEEQNTLIGHKDERIEELGESHLYQVDVPGYHDLIEHCRLSVPEERPFITSILASLMDMNSS
jgi:WD40 repeat protein